VTSDDRRRAFEARLTRSVGRLSSSPIAEPDRGDDLAIVLDGGGARAAYQVGLLRGLVRHHPDLRLPLLTGVSAGAINATFLAAHRAPPASAIADLARLWADLRVEQVFRVDSASLLSSIWHWGLRLVSGGRLVAPPLRGLVDTAPLRRTLEGVFSSAGSVPIDGIQRNLAAGRLVGLAILTSSYTTGRTVAWVEGRNIADWERPFRHSQQCRLTVDHVMASAALPLFFPAVRLDGAWYGDGGIRLITPLSPAVHLGARRILAFSTRYARNAEEAARPQVRGYPPPAQIGAQLLNAVFLDDHDRDALNLARLNLLLEGLPADRRQGLRIIDMVFIRPSEDIGRLAAEYEPRLPAPLRHMLGGIGTHETTNADLLSLLMFQPEYLRRLMEIGERDFEARADDVAALLDGKDDASGLESASTR
jgi:NTE family protein